MHFDLYIAQTGKIKKADINCNKNELTPILIYTDARYSFKIPANINTTSIVYDIREFVPSKPDTNIFDCKELLDCHIQAIINQRVHRNQLFHGKSPNELWQENYVQQELLNKKALIDMCLRSKNPLKYGKNWIYDSVTERTYTGDWMPLCTSKSMYLKRDKKVKEDEEAKKLQNEYYSKIAADLDAPDKDK